MKLPDFTKSPELIRLMTKMGVKKVKPLSPINPVKEVVSTKKHVKTMPNHEEIKISKELTSTGIEVDEIPTKLKPNSLLEYRGRKVAMYIRDQPRKVNINIGWSGYRYHLCNCSTLQSMTAGGRRHRYMVTQRSDGLFKVNEVVKKRSRSGIVKMDLCRNCVDALKENGIDIKKLTLESYFQKYDSFIPEDIRHIELVKTVQKYQKDHEEIAIEYKKQRNWQCDDCAIYLETKENSTCLHMHHINGNKADNSPNNIEILCTECHADRQYHSQMKNNPQFRDQIKKIRRLRKIQKY